MKHHSKGGPAEHLNYCVGPRSTVCAQVHVESNRKTDSKKVFQSLHIMSKFAGPSSTSMSIGCMQAWDVHRHGEGTEVHSSHLARGAGSNEPRARYLSEESARTRKTRFCSCKGQFSCNRAYQGSRCVHRSGAPGNKPRPFVGRGQFRKYGPSLSRRLLRMCASKCGRRQELCLCKRVLQSTKWLRPWSSACDAK